MMVQKGCGVFRAVRGATKGPAFGNRELLKKLDQNFYLGTVDVGTTVHQRNHAKHGFRANPKPRTGIPWESLSI